MDLAQSHGVQVPKVFGYSADPDNPVGAEYILMEKVQGRPLGDIWFMMAESAVRHRGQRGEALCPRSPGKRQCLYDKDLPQSMGREPLHATERGSQALCMGPDVSLKFWFEERSDLHIPRKPCMSSSFCYC